MWATPGPGMPSNWMKRSYRNKLNLNILTSTPGVAKIYPTNPTIPPPPRGPTPDIKTSSNPPEFDLYGRPIPTKKPKKIKPSGSGNTRMKPIGNPDTQQYPGQATPVYTNPYEQKIGQNPGGPNPTIGSQQQQQPLNPGNPGVANNLIPAYDDDKSKNKANPTPIGPPNPNPSGPNATPSTGGSPGNSPNSGGAGGGGQGTGNNGNTGGNPGNTNQWNVNNTVPYKPLYEPSELLGGKNRGKIIATSTTGSDKTRDWKALGLGPPTIATAQKTRKKRNNRPGRSVELPDAEPRKKLRKISKRSIVHFPMGYDRFEAYHRGGDALRDIGLKGDGRKEMIFDIRE